MTTPSFTVRPEKADDSHAVNNLIAEVFGPAMYARAAFALREGIPHEPTLAFVAERDGVLAGSVRLTRINWGDRTALMLGPLGVLPQFKSLGIGKALMGKAVEAARKEAADGGPEVIMLVGDLDYYAPFGFSRISPDRISLPRPADPQRVLACELVPGALEGFSGAATRQPPECGK